MSREVVRAQAARPSEGSSCSNPAPRDQDVRLRLFPRLRRLWSSIRTNSTGGVYGRTLTGTHIRLITILPSKDTNGPVHCTLEGYALNDAPQYEALSYVWGHPNVKKEKIICNGQSVRVTPNLRAALKRLRRPTCTRRIWADALSIAQNNDEEKSHQIPLMRRIYSSASKVIVWLGNVPPAEALAAARAVKEVASEEQIYGFRDNDGVVRRILGDFYASDREGFKRALCQFFANPWFTRIWCVQEVRFALGIEVHFGPEPIAWADIIDTAKWFADLNRFVRDIHLRDLAKDLDYGGAILMGLASENQSLLNTLNHYRNFAATDPRDKIYAIHGLVSSDSEVEAIHIDYGTSVVEVYAATVRNHIKLSSTLDILSHVCHEPEYDGDCSFNSWIPRWDIISWWPLPLTGLRDTLEWTPKRELHVQCMNGETPNHLLVCGVLYSTVTSVSMMLLHEDLLKPLAQPFAPPFLQYYGELLGLGDFWTPEAISAIRKPMRTFTAGGIYTEGGHVGADEASEDEQHQFTLDFLAYMDRLAALYLPDDPSFTSELFQQARVSGDWWRYQRRVEVICDNRRLFANANGSYGIGPLCLREGDVTVVLYGGSMPYALRPRGDGEEYLFLGEMYVDEINTGGIEEDLEAGKFEERDFVLV